MIFYILVYVKWEDLIAVGVEIELLLWTLYFLADGNQD